MKAITFGILESKDGNEEALIKLIHEHMDAVKQQPGLKEGYVARAKGSPNKFLVASVWENEEAQQAAMVKLSGEPGAARNFLEMMQVLKGQPDFGNYLVESISNTSSE
ncbi:putative quinol monooxygenase [Desulforamulus ruminis]|uniref:putative quinol monooxygenase n=1 Tax=Desulforamulus ruminis TaxID=1564 RepID=UPI002356A8EE|nr:antibiotic biosynthesis monooxygenase family protein [Desulforamulus ruminis]